MTAREWLSLELRLAKVSLNSNYGRNPQLEIKRSAELYATVKWNFWLLQYTEKNTIGM